MRVAAFLLLALLVPTAAASPYEAAPRVGDAADYLLRAHGETLRVVLEWRADAVFLPTGETRTLPTLRATMLHDHAQEAAPMPVRQAAVLSNPFVDSGVAPANALVVSLHWLDPADAAVAWSTGWLDTTDGDRRWATRTTLGGCAPETWLLAWANEGCVQNATLTYGPRHSLPDHVSGPGWSLDRLAARPGGDAFPVSSTPLAPVVTLPLLSWTHDGPAKDDLRDHAFADAKRTLVAQEPEAAAYFVQHRDARLLQARHVWTTSTLLVDDPWGERIKGVPCAATAAERAPGGEWYASWISDKGSLFGLVQQFGSGTGVQRVLASSVDSYNTRHVGGEPAARAPSAEALAAQLGLVPEEYGDIAAVEIDFQPTGAQASVSRGTCTRDPATGRFTFSGASVTFVDGRAAETLLLQAERERPTVPLLAAAGGGSPSSSVEAPRVPAGLAPAEAAVAAAGGLAIVTVAFALFSRIDRSRALKNAKRARIYEEVKNHPGLSVQEIADAVGLPRNTVDHHLRTLAKNGYVDLRDGARGKAVHPTGSRLEPHARLLQREHVPQILAEIGRSPGIAQGELAARVGMSKSHLSELAGELVEAGLLRRERNGRSVSLHLSSADAS